MGNFLDMGKNVSLAPSSSSRPVDSHRDLSFLAVKIDSVQQSPQLCDREVGLDKHTADATVEDMVVVPTD
ncbi:hypothetical protein Syun_025535 [Stephania yunnanensis]|uniref:Uncharacterized protein n=1 Tax=Stephania yunnanensis TaxID=152371 RepID=A0AAP0HWA0_9MAGN